MNNYQDLKIWNKAMYLVEQVYLLMELLPEDDKYGLISQIKDVQFLFLQILQKVLEEILKKNLNIF